MMRGEGTPELAMKKCKPCSGETARLQSEEMEILKGQLEGWEVVNGHHLTKTYRFDDFAQALCFVNRVGKVAEAEDHHPEIHLSWGKVRIEVWTHAIDGLSENDFILAAKCDERYAG